MSSKFFFILILLFFSISKSQSIEVYAKDGSGVSLENINVQLQKDGQTFQFKKTDVEGKCSFDISEKGIYQLKFTSFSYKTEILEIDTNLRSNFEIVLEQQISEIQEVKIKSRPKIAFIKEDTISYNIIAVKDGTEITTEDLIKKLPGFDVNENGKVTFKGSPIGQVLVDGNELFGGNHKIATQNIASDMLEGIDMWQNYTNISGSRSTALNLKLKDKYKNKINGSIEGDYGTKNSYYSHLNLFRFGKTGNLAFIWDANNIAKDPISFVDFHEMNTIENNVNEEGIIRREAPSFLNNDGKVKSKDNQFGAIQYSKSSKTFSISGYSIFNNTQLSKVLQTRRTAFANQPLSFSFDETSIEDNQGLFGTTQIKLRKNFNDNFIYYHFGYNPTKDNFNKRTERFSENDLFFDIEDKIKKQNLYNFLSWNKSIGYASNLIFSYSQYLEIQKTKLNIASTEDLFLTDAKTISQQVENENNQHSLDFFWKNSNEFIKFNLHSGFKIQDRAIDFGELVTFQSEKQKYQYQFFTNDLFLRKQFGKFDLNATITSRYVNVTELQKHYFEPMFRIKFTPKTTNSIDFSLEYNQQYKIPETENLIFSNWYNKNLTFRKNIELTPLLLSKTKNYQFNSYLFNSTKGNFLFLNASYSVAQPIFSTNTINYGNFSEIDNRVAKENENYFFVISADYALGKYLRLKTKINFIQNNYKNFIENQSNSLKMQSIEVVQKLSTKFQEFPIQFELGYTLRNSELRENLFNTCSKAQNLKLSFNARTLIKNEWKANVSTDYLIQKTNNNSLRNLLIGGQISYQKKETSLEYNLLFNNILNLNSFHYIDNFVTSVGVEEIRIDALHGYILGGLKVYF